MQSHWKRSKFVDSHSVGNLKAYFDDCLPEWFKNIFCSCCCSRSRIETTFELGRDQMNFETNIIEIIKSRRYFSAALKILLTPEQRAKLKERTRYITIKQSQIDLKENEIDKKKKDLDIFIEE